MPLQRDTYSLLPLIIFIEGFVSIAIEILTIRQLLPVAGGSVVVTSLVIGIFLLFLALGYQQGGKKLSNLNVILSKNFLIAAIWLGIGLSYIFIATFFYFIQKIVGPHIVYPLILYLLLVIAPLIYLLGQTVPITMNMMKQNQPAGVIGGNTLGMSTIGSFLGSILTTLIFMYYFGVAWTLFINFMLLIGLSLLLIQSKYHFTLQMCLAILAVIFVYDCNIHMEKSLFNLTNAYANYQVKDDTNSDLQKGEKLLIINDAESSYINKDYQGFRYIEAIKKILFKDLNLHNKTILVLGAGGFTLSAQNTNDNRFIYIDIDKQIKHAIVPQFIPQVNNELVTDDARHFLLTSNKLYPAIVIDAYSDIKSIPSHLLTREYMLEILHHLEPNGVVIFNIVANPMLSDLYSKRIDNTIRSVFANCMTIPIEYANHATNILYTCSNSASQLDHNLYSDNINNSTTNSFSW